MSEIKYKSKIKAQAGLNLTGLTASRVPVLDANSDVVASAVTSTELSSLSGVTSSIQTQLNGKINSDATLNALAAYNTNGLLTQTAPDTFAGRTILGTASNISVVNGDGVAGNPTLDLVNAGTAGTFGAANNTLTVTTDTKGRVTAVVVNAISILASQVSDFFASVRNTVLTGFVSTNAAVTNTDTVEQSVGKLQGQISALNASQVAGDISQGSFLGANNQAVAANVTGFAFSTTQVRSFKALASVSVDATAGLFEVHEILGVYKNGTWTLAISAAGDDSLVTFSITNLGQIQYVSSNYAGFVSLTIKFRAMVTHI